MPRKYQYNYDLRHLVYFREVAHHLHFRRAAESLALAQPALSRQIAQLETAFGVKLFVRSRRRVELTAAGQILAERIEPILRSLQDVGTELKSVAEGKVGHLKVAFTGLAMATVLPGLLREFNREFPNIRLELSESPTSVQLAALQAGDLACGFFHPDAATPGIATHWLLRERNGVVLPADHPLSGRETLRLRDLAETPFIFFPREYNPGFYDRILAAFAQASVTPRITEEVWPRANAIGFVRGGLGATLMCPSEAKQLPPEVVFRPLVGPAPESRLVLGWRQGSSEPSGPVAAFLKLAGAPLAAKAESENGNHASRSARGKPSKSK
ncbi:MAG TPA: LysR family transcriptional regulator [Opitutaceae bacterium]|nr:LysR family transcriptional regulator [Opitutaceae bacterium]